MGLESSVDGFWQGLVAEYGRFVASVDWSQRWLWALAVYLVVLLLALLVTRHRIAVQGSLFAVCLFNVAAAQPLNSLARQHWSRFASANYFGERGFFISVLWSVPHILLALVALVNILIGTARLAATVKSMELRQKNRKKTKRD